jgi:hypothetical protein
MLLDWAAVRPTGAFVALCQSETLPRQLLNARETPPAMRRFSTSHLFAVRSKAWANYCFRRLCANLRLIGLATRVARCAAVS